MAELKKALESIQMPNYPGLNGDLKEVDRYFLMLSTENFMKTKPGKKGPYEVKIDTIPARELMKVVTDRMMLMMGYKVTDIRLAKPRKVFKLLKNGSLMMTNTPQEMFYHWEAFKAATGRVLVGGLGLGMYPTWISRKSNVKEIVIVEIEGDIIELVGPYLPKNCEIIHMDLFDFLKQSNDKEFDFIYIDIYYQTGLSEYITTVLPLRKILNKKWAGIPAMFWAEDEMKSQFHPNDLWAQRTAKKLGVLDLLMTGGN